MRKKRVKISKSDKILLIVENSEEIFFNGYLKEYLKNNHKIYIDCQKSGSNNKCEIQNFNKMNRKIVEAIDDGYKAVFLMIDLDTQCLRSDFNYDCLVELKKDYEPKYKIPNEVKDRFYFFIVCREIENWFLTIDENQKGITDSIKNAKEKLAKFLKTKESEIEMVQKVTNELNRESYKLNFEKNKSLIHFINKLQEF